MGESDKPVFFQSHHLLRQVAVVTAAVTPRSSDKEGAERWEFLPSCGEAINPSLIPALGRQGLLTAAQQQGERLSSLAPSLDTPAAKGATGQVATQVPGPHSPLQEEEVVVIQGRVRRARGQSKEQSRE